MNAVTVTQAKAQFSRLIDRVARGETVLVLRRGHVIARIEPAGSKDHGDEVALLDALERDGVLRRAARPPDPKALEGRKPAAPRGKGLLGALLAEREEGR